MRRALAILVVLLATPQARATPIGWGLPASGTSFAPVTHIYTSGSAATETIPAGASQVVEEVCGAGGGGGSHSGVSGAGGGSGGYVKATLALTSANWGQTFIYTVAPGGAGGAGSGPHNGSTAAASVINSGTYPTSVDYLADGGTGGNTNIAFPGLGGAASGGDVNNSGNDGSGATGASGVPGVNCTTGVGGNGEINPTAGDTGGGGTVVFAYT